MLELGPLAFAAPWMLTALAVLPLLWWLLRVTPPAPRNIRFPAIRLLFGLESPERTPESSPLWLILLRLLAVALLILALAHPLMNPSSQLQGDGPLVLAVDDGWAASSRWPERQEAMRQAITRADRDGRGVVVLTTAPSETELAPTLSGVLKPSDARGLVDALRPKPWGSDHAAAAAALESTSLKATGSSPVLWLSDSLQHDATDDLVAALERFGPVAVVRDEDTRMPAVLQSSDGSAAELAVTVRRADSNLPMRHVVRAVAEDGRTLGSEVLVLEPGQTDATVEFDFPTEIRNEVARFDLDGEESAAAVALLDERWRRRPVGLASDRPLDSGPALLSETFYVERALAPYSDVRHGTLADLLQAQRAVIILSDGYAINPGDRAALDSWISEGGLLLRFAGPRLAADDADQLTPVRLRRGGRTLGGALLWSKPAQLAGFSEESPFADLPVPKEVTVSRQVLAEPTLDLAEKTWARLNDGTPLVTTERRGKGRIVLIHTTANTSWTTLPLSGLFVEMMRRIVA
ncbi:MAG: BatA domain-containing protein [Pseudomonadota bacterium]